MPDFRFAVSMDQALNITIIGKSELSDKAVVRFRLIPVARVVASPYQNLPFVQAVENDGNVCGSEWAGLIN